MKNDIWKKFNLTSVRENNIFLVWDNPFTFRNMFFLYFIWFSSKNFNQINFVITPTIIFQIHVISNLIGLLFFFSGVQFIDNICLIEIILVYNQILVHLKNVALQKTVHKSVAYFSRIFLGSGKGQQHFRIFQIKFGIWQ